MKIEIWCDIVCPFCGIANHRLDGAIASFEHNSETEVIHRSFQLHPELDRNGISQHELLVMRKRVEVEAEVLRPLERSAEIEGLAPFHAVERTLGPTDHIHELLAYATDNGIHAEAWREAFRVHFGEARKLWTIDEVSEFAAELGLDPVESRAVLKDRKYRARVEDDQRRGRQLGATGTPFMVIDQKYVVSGSRSSDELLRCLEFAWQNQQSTN